MLNNLFQRFQRMQGGLNPVNASDVSDDLVSTPSTPFRFACGTGTLVSGAATIATGLNSVVGFVASVSTSGAFATGATEVNVIRATAIATGSVTVGGVFNSFATGAATASVSGTSTFAWFAFGS